VGWFGVGVGGGVVVVVVLGVLGKGEVGIGRKGEGWRREG